MVGLQLSAHKSRDGVETNECDAAHFAALANANKPPISELLAAIEKAAGQAKERIAFAALRQPEKFRTLRSTQRRFAWRGSYFGLPIERFD